MKHSRTIRLAFLVIGVGVAVAVAVAVSMSSRSQKVPTEYDSLAQLEPSMEAFGAVKAAAKMSVVTAVPRSNETGPEDSDEVVRSSLSGRIVPPRAYVVKAGRRSTESDAGGRFEFEGLSPGTLKIGVMPPREALCDLSGVGGRRVLELNPGGNEVRIDLGERLSITLIASFEGVPVDALEIELGQTRGKSRSRIVCKTDLNGRVEFTGLSEGIAKVSGFGFDTFEVESRGDTPIELSGLPSYVEGAVAVRGEPLHGAVVVLKADDEVVDVKTTGKDGSFRSIPFEAGRSVFVTAYLEAERARAEFGGQSASLLLKSGVSHSAEFDFDLAFRRIRGSVSRGGFSVAGENLLMSFAADSSDSAWPGGRPTTKAVSDDDGNFEFRAIDGDVVKIRAGERALGDLIYVAENDLDLTFELDAQ